MENKKVQCLVNRADKSKPSSQIATVFAWSSKKHAVLQYPNEKLCICCWLILDIFHWVLLSVGLTTNNTWNCLVFWKELIIEDSHPISPYTHHLWMKTGLWCGWWWFISLVPWSLTLHIIVQCFKSTFQSLITICFKKFSLCFSRESCMSKYGQACFSLNLCGTQISKLLS